jgi:hypothetical protein
LLTQKPIRQTASAAPFHFLKFVMEKNAPEKMVKKTAGEISAQLVAQMKQYGAMPSPK